MSVIEKRVPTEQGVVISDKMDKTITVQVDRLVKHPLYGKYIKRRTRIHAHDEENQCRIGDRVLIQECRPISKHKSWSLVEVVRAAETLSTKA
jgi:small subunit ribosomal protein S17